MAVPDPNTGSIFVWLVSCLYLIAISTGGVFLFLYIALPENRATHWFPFIGLTLVGIPWICWSLTWFYRCITPRGDSPVRAGGGGVRRGGGKRGGGGGGANPRALNMDGCVATTSGFASTPSPIMSPCDDTRQVRFGATIVVDEQGGKGPLGQERNGTEEHRTSTSSSASSHDDISVTSHDSQIPLK